MTRNKQHYSFTFENPEDSIPETDWSSLFSRNRLKKKDHKADILSEKIAAPIQNALPKEESTSNVTLTERFFGIVEALMKI